MIDFDFVENCCGCGACSNICPANAIVMKAKEDGFLYPTINTNKCINCNKCNQVCPHLHAKDTLNKTTVKAAWLYNSKDNNAKMRSSSGAAFYELAKAMLKQDAYICGCVWNKDLQAVHMVANDAQSLYNMQGSKYVQSNMENSYHEIIKIVKAGKRVLFSGTPCQAIAAHRCVMAVDNGKYRDNLITIGVICHGVASPLAWNTFKQWTNKKNNSRLVSVNFRDKSKEGYKKSYCRYEYESGKVTYCPTYLPTSKYIEATLVYNLALRKSCSHCDCKGNNKAIDLILGDWYEECEGEGSLGTSCIVAFTDRGKKYAEEHLRGLRSFDYKTVIKKNHFIVDSEKLGKNRDRFLELIHEYRAWNTIEKLYPKKYWLKKILIKVGLYDVIKRS